MVQDYGSSNTYTWTPTAVDQGTYSIEVWARLRGSTADYQARRTAADVTVADNPITIGAIEPDVALPAATGTTVTWRARAVGGPAPLQYRFSRYSFQTSKWTVVRDYDVSNAYTWAPGASDVGAYAYQVTVRGNGTGAASTSRNSDVFEIRNTPPAVAFVSADKVSPVGAGTRITWTAQAAGGPGPLQYQFSRYRASTGSWTVVQPYGFSNTFSWTPQSTDAGTYSVLVYVRRAGSTAAYDASAVSTQIKVSTSSPPAVTGITASTGSVLGSDMPVTWTVAATGGSGALQYKFWLYNVSRDVWMLLQDYGTSNKVSWTPRTTDAGDYILNVWVKSSSSTAAADTIGFAPRMTVTPSPPAVQSITANVSTATVGMPIAWTAIVSGGQGSIEYAFLRSDPVTQTWRPVQNYSWDNTFGWVPQTGDQGTYQILVCVRRSGAVAADSCLASAPLTVAND
jgi:N-acetylmuramoyl-L-alanine amidase